MHDQQLDDPVHMFMEDHVDMVEALDTALKMGWRGFIEAVHDRTGNEVWVMELNGDESQQIAAKLGDTLTFTETTITK